MFDKTIEGKTVLLLTVYLFVRTISVTHYSFAIPKPWIRDNNNAVKLASNFFHTAVLEVGILLFDRIMASEGYGVSASSKEEEQDSNKDKNLANIKEIQHRMLVAVYNLIVGLFNRHGYLCPVNKAMKQHSERLFSILMEGYTKLGNGNKRSSDGKYVFPDLEVETNVPAVFLLLALFFKRGLIKAVFSREMTVYLNKCSARTSRDEEQQVVEKMDWAKGWAPQIQVVIPSQECENAPNGIESAEAEQESTSNCRNVPAFIDWILGLNKEDPDQDLIQFWASVDMFDVLTPKSLLDELNQKELKAPGPIEIGPYLTKKDANDISIEYKEGFTEKRLQRMAIDYLAKAHRLSIHAVALQFVNEDCRKRHFKEHKLEKPRSSKKSRKIQSESTDRDDGDQLEDGEVDEECLPRIEESHCITSANVLYRHQVALAKHKLDEALNPSNNPKPLNDIEDVLRKLQEPADVSLHWRYLCGVEAPDCVNNAKEDDSTEVFDETDFVFPWKQEPDELRKELAESNNKCLTLRRQLDQMLNLRSASSLSRGSEGSAQMPKGSDSQSSIKNFDCNDPVVALRLLQRLAQSGYELGNAIKQARDQASTTRPQDKKGELSNEGRSPLRPAHGSTASSSSPPVKRIDTSAPVGHLSPLDESKNNGCHRPVSSPRKDDDDTKADKEGKTTSNGDENSVASQSDDKQQHQDGGSDSSEEESTEEEKEQESQSSKEQDFQCIHKYCDDLPIRTSPEITPEACKALEGYLPLYLPFLDMPTDFEVDLHWWNTLKCWDWDIILTGGDALLHLKGRPKYHLRSARGRWWYKNVFATRGDGNTAVSNLMEGLPIYKVQVMRYHEALQKMIEMGLTVKGNCPKRYLVESRILFAMYENAFPKDRILTTEIPDDKKYEGIDGKPYLGMITNELLMIHGQHISASQVSVRSACSPGNHNQSSSCSSPVGGVLSELGPLGANI